MMRFAKMMIFFGAMLSVVLGAADSRADSLGDAKAAGYIGERPDGYLGLVDQGAPPSVKALMDDVNRKRREQYQQIAKKNGTELRAVELLAGEKAIEKTPPRQFIQTPAGSWVRK